MNDKSKTITAKEMNRTGRGFRDAFLGNTVKINHNNFPDGIFELTYRPRMACFSDEPPKLTLNSSGIPTKETSAESFRYEERYPLPDTKWSGPKVPSDGE